jgi:hypothetical protein
LSSGSRIWDFLEIIFILNHLFLLEKITQFIIQNIFANFTERHSTIFYEIHFPYLEIDQFIAKSLANFQIFFNFLKKSNLKKLPFSSQKI